jgi:mRNA interferase RelE/StbE
LQLADVLESVRAAGTLKQIANLKKLKGYKTAYRIRMGEHRIAFVIEDEVIKLSRVMNRKEIYRYFP